MLPRHTRGNRPVPSPCRNGPRLCRNGLFFYLPCPGGCCGNHRLLSCSTDFSRPEEIRFFHNVCDERYSSLSNNVFVILGSKQTLSLHEQQRRPPPVAETGRSCWGSGQQDASAKLCTKRTLGAATRTLASEARLRGLIRSQTKTASAVERRRKRRWLCMRTPKHLRLSGDGW